MRESQVNQLAESFLQKTGIDLQKYRHHELASSLLDLSSLPGIRSNYFKIPLIASILVVCSVYYQAKSPLQEAFALLILWLISILLCLLIFLVHLEKTSPSTKPPQSTSKNLCAFSAPSAPLW